MYVDGNDTRVFITAEYNPYRVQIYSQWVVKAEIDNFPKNLYQWQGEQHSESSVYVKKSCLLLV